MPTVRYVQRSSLAGGGSSAGGGIPSSLHPETVASAAAAPPASAPDSTSADNSRAPFLAAADDSSAFSASNGTGNAAAAAGGDRPLTLGGVDRLSAPGGEPSSHPGPGLGPQQQQQQQQQAVTPGHPHASHYYDNTDHEEDRFADAEENDDDDDVDDDAVAPVSALGKARNTSFVVHADSKPAVAATCDENRSRSTTCTTTTAATSTAPTPSTHMPPVDTVPNLSGPNCGMATTTADVTGKSADATASPPGPADGGANNNATGTSSEETLRRDDELREQAEALVQVHKDQMQQRIELLEREANGADAAGVAAAAAAAATAAAATAPADATMNAAAAAALSAGIPDEPLPHEFSIEVAKAVVRLQRQVQAEALDDSNVKSIGSILGKRHNLLGPGLFKDVMDLPEVKDSAAATEEVRGRMARYEAVVDKKDIIDGIGPHDVLFGRGGRTNLHEGNVHFRSLLGKFKLEYINASKNSKPNLAREIVYMWRNLEPPGRFLRIQEVKTEYDPENPDKFDPDVEIWEDVGNNRAQQKTSQCLRERNPQIRAAEGIAALFRAGQVEKHEQKRREEERRKAEEREKYKARRTAAIAAYRARQARAAAAAAAAPAYVIAPTLPAAMAPYYQQQQLQPLLNRRITSDGTTPPSAAPAALSLITPTTASPTSACRKKPRIGFPETLVTGAAIPAAPLWQQPPVATALAVAAGPYDSADVSAQVAAEVQHIASLQEKIKAAQERIENAHQRIDASKPETSPALAAAPSATPAMPQSQIAHASTMPVAPMPALYPTAAAMAMPPPPYPPVRLPPPPPPHYSLPAYHLAAYPAGIPNQYAYPVAAMPGGGSLHRVHPPPPPPPHATTFAWYAGQKTTAPSDMSSR